MLYKHSFSILCGHLNLNKKNLNLTGYPSNRPVYRYEPFAQRILNSNLTSTGFRPNRSGIPVPDPAGLAGPVCNLNPARDAGVFPNRGGRLCLSQPFTWDECESERRRVCLDPRKFGRKGPIGHCSIM